MILSYWEFGLVVVVFVVVVGTNDQNFDYGCEHPHYHDCCCSNGGH